MGLEFEGGKGGGRRLVRVSRMWVRVRGVHQR